MTMSLAMIVVMFLILTRMTVIAPSVVMVTVITVFTIAIIVAAIASPSLLWMAEILHRFA